MDVLGLDLLDPTVALVVAVEGMVAGLTVGLFSAVVSLFFAGRSR